MSNDLEPRIRNTKLHNNRLVEKRSSYLGGMLMTALRGYQKVISPVDGERCNMYPTCSAYSYKAYREYGLIAGTLLTFDRLTHESDEYTVSRIIVDRDNKDWLIDTKFLVYDPLGQNVFWWDK